MANYTGTGRSNYMFWDRDKLAALQALFPIHVVSKDQSDPDAPCALISREESGVPIVEIDLEDEDQAEQFKILEGADAVPIPIESDCGIFELIEVVHLAFADTDKNGLFIWMEAGSENARYVSGSATAIDRTGEIVKHISLNQIYWTDGITSRAEF